MEQRILKHDQVSDQIAVFIDFENVALWAEQEFLDFELTPMMEFLQSRGPVVVKRAYADWGRFAKYRDDMLNNSIDLTQLYSVRSGKNRADIRLAIDALEIAMTRPHIRTFVIVSGDSDFGALAARLREYGRYTLGIGPRKVTHPLLVRSCDEFVYLETLLGETPQGPDLSDRTTPDYAAARNLLQRALQACGQRGEIPVLATRLKQTMLLIDPTFNEVNLGYSQFKSWLEDNRDLARLLFNGLQLYVAPSDFPNPAEHTLDGTRATAPEQQVAMPPPLELQYRQSFNRRKLLTVDLETRRDVLRDVFREISARPGERTTDELLDELHERYETQNKARSKTALRQIWQMAFRQRAFDYGQQSISLHVPVRLSQSITTEAQLIQRAESSFVYAIIQDNLPLDHVILAEILLNDRSQTEYVGQLIADLEERAMIQAEGDRYVLPGRHVLPINDSPTLHLLYRDIEQAPLQPEMAHTSNEARTLANTALVQRTQDFAAAAQNYLVACRLQWLALEANEPGAMLEDLRWYMASYASVKAGELSQIRRDYVASRPYYLAFFALVREEDPLWHRMRGLINPMLSYYWANAGRELGIDVAANPGINAPHQVAVLIATYPNMRLRELWQTITHDLAQVNSGLLRRVVSQLRLNQTGYPEYALVADQIEAMLIS